MKTEVTLREVLNLQKETLAVLKQALDLLRQQANSIVYITPLPATTAPNALPYPALPYPYSPVICRNDKLNTGGFIGSAGDTIMTLNTIPSGSGVCKS